MTEQIIQANEKLIVREEQLRSAQDQVSDLKFRLITQNEQQGQQNRHFITETSPKSYLTTPSNSASPTSSLGNPTTTTETYNPTTPKNGSNKRHHRTATPEQRQIRDIMQAPVYTLGIDPQTDRGLLCDFFEAIKTWVATYTINLHNLTTSQIHTLAAHAVLASLAIPRSQLTSLVTEKDMLPSLLTAVISRYIFNHTIDTHALSLSGHPYAHMTLALTREWSFLLAEDSEKKDALLQRQRTIYTAIKNLPDHKIWRANCAHTFTESLLSSLSSFLTPLTPIAAKNRAHIIQELFVKGYRIGFRLHMSVVKWDFWWPVPGQGFDGRVMVNESRILYGDVMRTMEQVRKRESEHVVRFARSPMIWRADWGVGGERVEVVHSACVEVGRRV
jgi:hypothetical protein